MEKFYLDDYLKAEREAGEENRLSFEKLCSLIYREFQTELEKENNIESIVELQKKAIIGFEKEVEFFKNKIKAYVKKRKAENTEFPAWYETLEDGIYHEKWGMAGIAEWFSDKFKESSSCKIIGERIYFQENGSMVLKPQKILKERREQLIRAFLLLTPEERLDKDFLELYTREGIRITVFRGNAVKEGEDVIVFRRYIIPNYTFEEQAKRGTIPWESIELFKKMVKLGYSVAVTGAMKSGKTSFLATMQAYEDEKLEGVMLETDPEISMHKIMPKAPIVQVLAKDEEMKTVVKHLLRSDADYLIMAEARDGIALDTVLRIAGKGTRRLKITFHERNPMNFPYDVAAEIQLSLGGDMDIIAKRAADSFDYILHFVQLKDKGKKRLKGIYEIYLDKSENKIVITRICKYDFYSDKWYWKNFISEGKANDGNEESPEIFKEFSKHLAELAEQNPM